MHQFRRAVALGVVALLAGVALVACGDDDNDPALSGEARGEIAVTGIDYAYEGIPSEVPAGTQFVFTNASDKEPHELVLFRIPDDEKRSLMELLSLPQEEVEAIVGEPHGVSVAARPGEPGDMALGTLLVEEAGRYAAVCFLPVGVSPERVESSQGPLTPEEGDGPPHFTRGMADEFVVSG